MSIRKQLIVGALLATAAAATASTAMAQGYPQQMPMMGYGMGPGMMMGYGMGPGMMGPNGMMGYGMGPGMMGNMPMMGNMMGPGMMGYGMMGPYWGGNQALNLTVNDVKGNLERWVASTGNPNIKVGNVVEKDANTITADVVTKDNSLVQQYTVDRRTGFYRPQ